MQHEGSGRSTQLEARSRDGIASASNSTLLNSPQVAGGGEPQLRERPEKWKVNAGCKRETGHGRTGQGKSGSREFSTRERNSQMGLDPE